VGSRFAASTANDVEGTGRVIVTALMTASHRVDADVEKIVGRLSLEPTVSRRPLAGRDSLRCRGPAKRLVRSLIHDPVDKTGNGT